MRGDDATGDFDRERCFADELLIVEEAGENSQTIARFFRLRAIRIKDAQTKLRLGRGQGTPENPIGARAKIAVTDHPDLLAVRRRPAGKIGGVQHNVIVAQSVVFIKAHAVKPLTGPTINTRRKFRPI